MVFKTSDFSDRKLYETQYDINTELEPEWPILALIGEKENNRVEGKTKLAKELFLVKAGNHILLPLEFTKFPNGPYTKQITYQSNDLEESGLIERKEKSRYNKEHDTIEFRLTDAGKDKYREDISPHLDKFIRGAFKHIHSPHHTGSDLSRICYSHFRLKKEQQDENLWMESRDSWLNEISSETENLLSTHFKSHISRDLEYNLMMPVKYVDNILQEGSLNHKDLDFQVKSGVILYTMESLLNSVNEALQVINSKDPETEDLDKVRKQILILDRTFYFLNQYAEDNEVYPSLYNENNTAFDFLSNSDRQRLQNKIPQ